VLCPKRCAGRDLAIISLTCASISVTESETPEADGLPASSATSACCATSFTRCAFSRSCRSRLPSRQADRALRERTASCRLSEYRNLRYAGGVWSRPSVQSCPYPG